jgi:hypothetical protein
MKSWMRGASLSAALLAALLAPCGCGEGTDGGGAGPVPRGGAGPSAPPVAGPVSSAPVPTTPEETGKSPSIKKIMGTLTKGPNSLTPVIGKELHEDPPPWETIQGQTREYTRLAALLGQDEPPKGSAESWAKQAASYAETAAALDRAAQAKDEDAALEAHGALERSCMSCHREHRVMGPGRGMPPGSGPPGGPPFMPPGGPPPK